MGGKRQSQRTKNNTRPSSSGRSAELLGSSMPQFAGFSGIKENVLASSGFTFASADDFEAIPDTKFQLVFKKMTKKDSTTKLKALQHYSYLVGEAEVETIKTILPFWPRLYCTLALDSEHKIRETTQIAHRELVLRAKRNLAPHLKQIIGTWFISQYDTYAPAASVATRAFQESFPNRKAQEAIVFCHEEILSYIFDNLTIQIPETITSSKETSSECAESKSQRIIISSLNSYVLYLNKVSSQNIEKQYDLNFKIVSNPNFWNISNSKVPSIRLAWFTALTTLCKKVPLLTEKESPRIVGAVFSSLDENDPIVLPAVWDTVLSILTTIKEWWTHVSIDNLLLPKLHKILRNGGNGNASMVFPNLLIVISHLPKVVDVNLFYPTFFESLRIGLKTISTLGSRSESQAVAIAFIECLQYISMRSRRAVELCEKLIETQLFPLVEWTFIDTSACYKSIYNQIAKLIQFWDRDHVDYGKYFMYFWHNLESLFLRMLLSLTNAPTECELTLTQLSTRQIELITSLKHLTRNKKYLKVTFNPMEQHAMETDSVSDFSEPYTNALDGLVYKICEAYVKIIKEKQSKELLEHLVYLIQNFDSLSFFMLFNTGNQLNFRDVYKDLLLGWLYDDLLRSSAVVDLIFILFKYFDDEVKMEILNRFCDISNEECLVWCLRYTLCYPNYQDPIVLKWLCSETVNHFLITIAQETIANKTTTERNLILKQIFTEKLGGGLILSKTIIQDIIKILVQPLLDPIAYPENLDTCASFASRISTVVYTSHLKLSFGHDLFDAMFTLANSIVPNDVLTTDTRWEIDSAWKEVIILLCAGKLDTDIKEVTKKCAAILTNKPTGNSAALINSYIVLISINYPSLLEPVLYLFFKHDFVEKWRNDVSIICKYAEYIRGGLYINNKAIDENVSIDENNIENYFKWMDFMLSVFVKILKDTPLSAMCQLGDFFDTKCTYFVLEFFAASSFGTLVTQNYPSIKSIHNVKQLMTDYHEKLLDFYQLYPKFEISVETKLINRLLEGGWIWVKAVYDFYVRNKICDRSSAYCQLVTRRVDKSRKELILQITQTWAPCITYDQFWDYPSIMEAVLMLRCVINNPELETKIAEAFGLIERFKQTNPEIFKYSSNMAWVQVELIIEIIRLFSGILKFQRESIQTNRWDLIVTSFVTWCENVEKSLSMEVQTKSVILALSDLFSSIMDYIPTCGNESIVKEWEDIFVQDVHTNILKIWCYFVDHHLTNSNEYYTTDLSFLQSFGKMIPSLDSSYIFSKSCSVKWCLLFSRSCSLLTHPLTTMQLWGYNMIVALIPGLVKIDATAVNTNTPHQDGLIINQYKTTLCHIQEIIQSMLLDFRLGEDSCRVQPFTDSYTYTFAYVLLWDTILCLCEKSSPELRYQYSDWLKKEDFISNLLMNLFKLIPLDFETIQPSWFTKKCSFDFTDPPTSQLIEKGVCWIYSYLVSQLPVSVRQWWCNQDSRVAHIVEKITSTFVSSNLCNQELADMMKHQHKFKNMTIKTYPAIREVVAIYTVDEVQMELILTLPQNYPLVGPDVRCDKQILGTSQRQWLMQLKLCVLHQDGRILDGLMLWNNNLEKRFEGVQECYICFSVIHQGTYQIPRLSCQMCKKKFHSACLYKWFSTSNKSSCPVCRNLF